MLLLRPFLPVVRESPAVYRPRHPEMSEFYRTMEDHFDEFAILHEERFEREDGPLRSVVGKVVDQYLDCGILTNGFARVRCPQCRAEYLVPFSCRTRNFCSSCQQKRALLFAEKLREEILAPVPHRHMIFTIPVALRRLFLRERRLLGLLARCAFETVARGQRAVLGRDDGVPGMVVALQTFGSRIEWNPHGHCLASDGLLLPGGGFIPMPPYDEEYEQLLTETYRRLVLDALVKEERLSAAFREKLLTWRHGGGFSVYGRHLILNEEPARLAHMARYALRAPVAMDRITVADDGRIHLAIPPDQRTGDIVLALDPMEWIRKVTNQIPEPRMHTTRSYGPYANRCRRINRSEEPDTSVRIIEVEAGSRSRSEWARLLRKVFEVDPLTCRRCGAEMVVISVITAPALIDRILRHVREKTCTNQGKSLGAHAPPAA